MLTRRPRIVVLIWVSFVAVAAVVGAGVAGDLVSVPEGDTSTESQRVEDTLVALGATSPDVVALYDEIDPEDPVFAERIQAVDQQLSRTPGVVGVQTAYDTGPFLTSDDGRATLVAVVLDRALDETETDALVADVEHALRSVPAGGVLVGGTAVLDREAVEQTEADLQKAELLTIPITAVLAVVIFGGLIAASLPLIIALVAIPGSLFVLWVLTRITDVQLFALSAAAMLGLGLAVDYALLIVNRFREERAAGRALEEAVERTVATAGTTVVFSGLTVAVALAGFLMLSGNVFPSIGMGSIGVVLLAMTAAVTLLPAVLTLVGNRIRPLRSTPGDGRVFTKVTEMGQRRPALIATVVTVGLILLAVPFLGVRLQIPGAESLPSSLETRRLLDARSERFAVGGEDPITAIVPGVGAEADAWVEAAAGTDDVQGARVRSRTDALTVIDVLPAGAAQSAVAEDVVAELRKIEAPVAVDIGGPAAELIDQRAALLARLPWALAFVVGSTLVLLFLLTGSVVMPFKALTMNLLSLTATFGILVWGFQDGHLSGLLGFEPVGFVGLWTPFLVFFISFGLSMDYEVFLLARIKEIYDETGDNDASVALGIARTGRIITSAAVLIALVFAAFATGGSLDMKTLGIGLATAILLDASVVRMLLVPAAMKLMGDRNWWAPAPLRRLHDRIGFREAPAAAAPLPQRAESRP